MSCTSGHGRHKNLLLSISESVEMVKESLYVIERVLYRWHLHCYSLNSWSSFQSFAPHLTLPTSIKRQGKTSFCIYYSVCLSYHHPIVFSFAWHQLCWDIWLGNTAFLLPQTVIWIFCATIQWDYTGRRKNRAVRVNMTNEKGEVALQYVVRETVTDN